MVLTRHSPRPYACPPRGDVSIYTPLIFMYAALLLLLIFVESSADFVHSEMMWRGIVLNVQPSPLNKSCAKDALLYTKRKGNN